MIAAANAEFGIAAIDKRIVDAELNYSSTSTSDEGRDA